MRWRALMVGALLGLGLSAAVGLHSVTVDARPLGVAAHARVQPALNVPDDDPLDWSHPAYWRAALGPDNPNRQEAALSVYPLEALLRANTGVPGQRLRSAVTHLRALLTARPAAPHGDLPYLLDPPAAQILAASVRYLDFPDGSGVRYLTMYSSDVSPVTADRVFYTFQGLTKDGQAAVVLTYPVTTRLLPATYDAVPAAQRDALVQGVGYDDALARSVRRLNGAQPAEFTPALDRLDAVVRSIRVQP